MPARADGASSPPSSPPAFAQDDAEAARAQWRRIADQLRPKLPKLAAFLDEAETDVLAYMSFPAAHRAKLHSTDEMDKRFLHGRDDDCGDRCKSILLFGSAAGHSSVPAIDLASRRAQGRSRLAAFAATARLGLDRAEHGGTLAWNGTAFLAGTCR
ncbi:hypothetical protein ACVIHH_008369 [Bradyrhizobium sp. USDA 4518]